MIHRGTSKRWCFAGGGGGFRDIAINEKPARMKEGVNFREGRRGKEKLTVVLEGRGERGGLAHKVTGKVSKGTASLVNVFWGVLPLTV